MSLRDHFGDRVNDRILSDDSTVSRDPLMKGIVLDNIKFLEKINFPSQDNLGVELFSSVKTTYFNNPRKNESSEGRKIWAVLRGNELETIIFSDYDPQLSQIQLPIERLIKYIEEIKNGNFILTDKDLRKIQEPNFLQPKEQKETPKHLVVNVDGV